MVRPALKRRMVDYIVSHYGTSQRRACKIVQQHRSIQWYRSRKDPRLALRARMRELSQIRVRYGYRRIQVLLRREGWSADRTLIYRLYREERLQLRSKLPKRRKMVVTRRDVYVPKRANQAWAMDFVSDQLTNGERFRALTIVDVFTREALAIEVGPRLRANHVIEACNRIAAIRGAPVRVFVDNGSEFSGRLLDLWAYHHKVRIDFSRPGKPTDNCFIETFNGSLRDECLNVHWFESIDEARAKIEAWRSEYNESRPHQALKEKTPTEFASWARALPLQLEDQLAGD
jgi:putative transposase